jgi:iron-sulfur cluster repair protein YtfE (RIC family)
MNAIEFLKKEHEKAKSAFKEIEHASANQRGQLWGHLAPELKLHEQLETRHFYGPLASDAGSRDETLAKWEREHEKEVHEAETMIHKISGANASEARWLEMVRELKAALERHIEKEEHDIWPRARNVWDAARLDQAGREMEQTHQRHAAAA